MNSLPAWCLRQCCLVSSPVVWSLGGVDHSWVLGDIASGGELKRIVLLRGRLCSGGSNEGALFWRVLQAYLGSGARIVFLDWLLWLRVLNTAVVHCFGWLGCCLCAFSDNVGFQAFLTRCMKFNGPLRRMTCRKDWSTTSHHKLHPGLSMFRRDWRGRWTIPGGTHV